MLSKRTNILFDDDLWELLTSVAKRQKTSVGDVVRNAIKKVYSEENIIEKRKKIFDAIKRIRPKPYPGKIDYKELINYGRKY